MVRIRAVTPLEGLRVHVAFTNGTDRVIDLTPYLNGPVFERVKRDRELFEAVQVDHALGTVTWPNGADIDPDVLYEGRTPAAWEAAPTAAITE